MAEQTMSERSDRYVNKNVSEFQQANRSPISDYENQEIVPLENAVEKIVPFVKDIAKYADSAKQNCNRTSDLLTWDESAAIYLYTMPTTFYCCLNKTLRAENRSELKPWFAFLKLFMNGLQKLPSSKNKVWRAVADDIGTFSNENDETIWWSVNSTSIALNVVRAYLSETSILFAIDTIHGKNIFEYSAFPEEEEVMLMPGTRLRVKSQFIHLTGSLSIIHWEEILAVEQNSQSDIVTQSSISEPPADNFSDIDLIEIGDSVHLVFNDPSPTRNRKKQYKIIVRASIVCATFTITIATIILLLFFLTNKQYSTSLVTNTKPMKFTEYTTSVPSHGFTTTNNPSNIYTTTDTATLATCTTPTDEPICPVPVVTNGSIVTINPIGRNLTGQHCVPGYTFFNSEDRIPTNGYIKTVTLRYESTQLPTAAARIWIYVIVPASGGYIVCSQSLVPSSQITTQVTQTYIFNDNTINVRNGAYVGIGISDTSASVKATYGGLSLSIYGADQVENIKTCSILHFQADVSRSGAQITYTIVT